MRRALALLITTCAVTAGCAGEPETRTLTVQFRLADYDTALFDCEGAGGYSDIGPGTAVTVRNASGDVVGSSKLGAGKPSSNGRQAAFCDWTTEVEVATQDDFYVVEIADRGEITMSADDLAADDWAVSVNLGQL